MITTYVEIPESLFKLMNEALTKTQGLNQDDLIRSGLAIALALIHSQEISRDL